MQQFGYGLPACPFILGCLAAGWAAHIERAKLVFSACARI